MEVNNWLSLTFDTPLKKEGGEDQLRDLLPQLASSGTGPSTSCLSAPFRPPRLRPRMCLISTCIVARLRRSWPTKTMSRTRIAGTRLPHLARSLPRFWRSGSGICDWNWGNSSPPPSCVRPNSLPHVKLHLSRLASQNPRKFPHLRSSMVLRNSHAPP